MRRLLIAAAATLAFMGQAAADKMPGILLGSWCLVPGSTSQYLWASESCDDFDLMMVGPRGFEIVDIRKVAAVNEAKCELHKLTKVGRGDYRMTFICSEKQSHFLVEQRWQRVKDVLTVTESMKVDFKDMPRPGNPPIYPKDRSEP